MSVGDTTIEIHKLEYWPFSINIFNWELIAIDSVRIFIGV